MVKLVSVNNGPLASNLIHVIGLKKTRDDGSTIISDTITIGREGTTTNIDSLLTRNIGYGPSNTLSIAGNVNVSMGNPTAVLSFTPSIIPGFVNQQARIAYGNGKFVLIGDTSKVYHSSNGTTWTQVTSPTFPGNMRTILFVKDKFMIVSEVTPVVVHTSTDGAIWNPVTITTPTTNSVIFAASYGNDIIVGLTPGTGTIYTSGIAGASWPQISLGSIKLYGVVFGTMSTATHGTNVFIVFGENIIRRNQGSPAESGPWTTLTPTGADSPGTVWYHGGFGNDTFMLTSMDPVTPSNPGLLTISRDAGKTWSTPLTFGITLRQPIYVEGVWYIASENDCMMISKNNGVTWEKRTTGIKSWFFSYGNGLFLTTHVSNTNTVINLIGLKTKRSDGSLITSDTITIGREGTNTTLVGNTVSLAGNVTVTAGNPTTRLSSTVSSVLAQYTRIAYGNGRFVIIGDTGKVFYSTNGTTWTAATPPNPTFVGTMANILFTSTSIGFMIITNASNAYTSLDGNTWTKLSTSVPNISPGYNSPSYGAGFIVYPKTNTNIISVSDNFGSTWTTVTTSTGPSKVGSVFGTMVNTANGTNVFIVFGPSLIRRNDNSYTTDNNWIDTTTPPNPQKSWRYGGFGNDTFMLTSDDSVSFLTISRDAGKTWSVPISFGINLRIPIYAEGVWYIFSDGGYILTSKDNGSTWEKRNAGTVVYLAAYGNGLIVGVNNVNAANNIINLIEINKNNDVSNITSEWITTINKPMTIAYPIPILNTQLGYYTSNSFTGSGITTGVSKAYCQIGPLLPGIYQANAYFMVNGYASNTLYLAAEGLARPTPFVSNAVITGSFTSLMKSGLHCGGYHTPLPGSNGQTVHKHISGIINIPDGSLDRYVCLSTYIDPSGTATIIFSVVRIA